LSASAVSGSSDDCTDAASQPLHDLVVFLFPDRHDLLEAQRRGIVGGRDPRGHVASQLGPEVTDQIRRSEHDTRER